MIFLATLIIFFRFLEFSVGEEDAVFAEGDDAVGWGCVLASDGAGVEVIDAVFILLCCLVGMTKKKYICTGAFGKGSQGFHSAFCAMGMAVEKDYFLAAEGYGIYRWDERMLGMPIAISTHVKTGYIAWWYGQKVRKSVPKEDCCLRIGVGIKGFIHIKSFTV